MGDLHLLGGIVAVMARSPSGKAEDCKSSIVGSIPTRASISLKPLILDIKGFFVNGLETQSAAAQRFFGMS